MKSREDYENQMEQIFTYHDSASQRREETQHAERMIIELLLDIRDLLVPAPAPKIPTKIEYILPFPPKTLHQKLAYVEAWIHDRKQEGVRQESVEIQLTTKFTDWDRVQVSRLLTQLEHEGRIYFDAHNGRIYPTDLRQPLGR